MNNSNISADELIKHEDFSYPYGIYKGRAERVLFQKTGNDNPEQELTVLQMIWLTG